MNKSLPTNSQALKLSAALLLAGQLFYIVISLFHTGGDANNHHAIFAAYAASGIWTAVHLGQFVGMLILLAGLFTLFFGLDVQDMVARWAGRFGAVMSAIALALYGVLQAVDGVALKQAASAWANAPLAEKSVRFAGAETVRWLEWGVRSYQNFTFGIALLLFAVACSRTAWLSRPISWLVGLSGLAYLVQGWMVGAEGFPSSGTFVILLAYIVSLVWMGWLAMVAWRPRSNTAITKER